VQLLEPDHEGDGDTRRSSSLGNITGDLSRRRGQIESQDMSATGGHGGGRRGRAAVGTVHLRERGCAA